MTIKLQARHIAGGLFAALCLWWLGFWAIMLFASNPPNVSAIDLLAFSLSTENEYQSLYIWFAVACVAWGILSLAYLATPRLSKPAAVFLLLVGLALGVSAFWFVDWELSVFAVVPLYWAFDAWRQA